jgi:hypothetical protein
MRKTRKIIKGGMQDFNQMVISNYSPITSKGGRKRKTKTKRNKKTKNKRANFFPFSYIR